VFWGGIALAEEDGALGRCECLAQR
jgi:hypothetical protein